MYASQYAEKYKNIVSYYNVVACFDAGIVTEEDSNMML